MKTRFLKAFLATSFAILAWIVAGAANLNAQQAPTDKPSAAVDAQQAQSPDAGAPPAPSAEPPQGPGDHPENSMEMPQGPGGPNAAPQGPGSANAPNTGNENGGNENAEMENKQGVGRISMIHGEVSTQRGDSGDWSAAVLNQPLVGGDKVSTGSGGRAEVQLDYANILRLSSNAQATIGDFTRQRVQVQIGQGLANYTVFGESEAEPEIDTPNVAIHPAHRDGAFRIEVRPDGDTIVIVRKGEAQISTPKGIAEIKQGEMATVRGSTENAQYKISPASESDDWDRWNSDRDHMIHSANSWQHTNRYYVGSEDLDKYGQWENVPDYGQVWVPSETSDWAPYRDGNWVYEPYYGWTWVGYEPWGWAPYHYGRWLSYGGSWAWWPGPVWGAGFYRPFWAPAYVSFFGFGGGWGFGFGLGWGGWGGFGWLPLGPCDWFHPWWGGFRGRFGVVNVARGGFDRSGGVAPLHGGTRFSNLAHMNDAHIGRGLSTVPAGRFGAGHVTAVAANRSQLSSARMMTGNMPVVPSRASLSASGRAAAPSTIHSGAAQHFFGTQSTAHAESFQQETAHLQQSMQQNHFSPVAAGGRETSAGAGESRGTALAGTGKSSTGTPSANSKARSGSVPERSINSLGSENRASENRGSENHGSENNGSANLGTENHMQSLAPSPANRSEPNRGEWKTFTPPSHSTDSASRAAGNGAGNAGVSGRGETGNYWSRTAPSSNYSRGSAAGSYDRGGSYSRPQLNMRQPIVQPRSYGGYRGGYSGGTHSAPSNSGGGHSSGGGGHSGGGHH